MKVLAVIRVIPIGTGSPSIGDYVREAVEVIKNRGIKYQVTPFGTAIEASSIAEVATLIDEIVERMRNLGVSRIAVDVSFDFRFDKELSLEYKVKRVTQ